MEKRQRLHEQTQADSERWHVSVTYDRDYTAWPGNSRASGSSQETIHHYEKRQKTGPSIAEAAPKRVTHGAIGLS